MCPPAIPRWLPLPRLQFSPRELSISILGPLSTRGLKGRSPEDFIRPHSALNKTDRLTHGLVVEIVPNTQPPKTRGI
jgi:hypothetical protein